jgi:hypothetical protein
LSTPLDTTNDFTYNDLLVSIVYVENQVFLVVEEITYGGFSVDQANRQGNGTTRTSSICIR